MSYYHIVVETKDKDKKGEFIYILEYDLQDIEKVKSEVVRPYVDKEEIYVGGSYIPRDNIRSLKVKKTEQTSSVVTKRAKDQLPRNVLVILQREKLIRGDGRSEDVTRELIESVRSKEVSLTNSEIPLNLADSDNSSPNLSKNSIAVTRKKKLQVFISSTYTDMLEERQAAVMAILEAGHIPVGMELFTAGDKEVFEAIKKWIDQSDVFLLILGGRYGSIDKVEQKSYTHMEYDYATAQGKPFFSLVMTQSATQKKISKFDSDYTKVIETGDSASKYDAFKATVTEKMCKMCDDVKDIKNATLTSLRDFEERPQLVGWVSGEILFELEKLQKENEQLRAQIFSA